MRPRCKAPRPVHPHVRGEHCCRAGRVAGQRGSSPRAWGTLQHPTPAQRSRRFIPTCVGNTQPTLTVAAFGPVHPHVRGEHCERRGRGLTRGGSSPRAWGTLDESRLRRLGKRFIPTCVGNTITSWSSRTRSSVHPHVRGEHNKCGLFRCVVVGSSPRAWGTRWDRNPSRRFPRFIPTCVGNTPSRKSQERLDGSSPRAWGTHPEMISTTPQHRFIPTCVGNTSCPG
ncbi:MAG: hypothetical protein HLUCCO17_03745 [Saliniramus fredricksonii]|uniref:Uncharacterized protein n=1 Tax=Saliniramus fredricksonii TaxID=1653334 RepID=A0A0P7XWN1_9HYPH|nr:MAG: hypothetical protein HLUCCO17_03745 [Saliniramus fredricksonii]